jgi:hypothetical protein
MKKFFLSLVVGVMIFAGAGCVGSKLTSPFSQNEEVEGVWRLAFDLPSGWVMVKEYDAPRKEAVMPSQNVTRDLPTVIVQSTAKAIVKSGMPDAAVSNETYVTSSFAQIRVDKLDARRVIPSDAEDLGNGFSFADGKYYFLTASGEKYQFVITTNGEDDAAARSVILSAQPVTRYVDTPSAVTIEPDDVTTNE